MKNNLNNIYRVRQAGFTLMELLIVFSILAVMATMFTTNLFRAGESTKIDATTLKIQDLSKRMLAYQLDNKKFPTTQEGFKALIEKPANAKNWRGPYIEPAKIPVDGWDRELMYRAPGENGRPFEIFSYGADGAAGGEDNNADIKSE